MKFYSTFKFRNLSMCPWDIFTQPMTLMLLSNLFEKVSIHEFT